jgi:6-phospho-beta-glucosidase
MEEGRLFGPELIRALGALPNEYLYWYYAQREALAGIRAAGRTRGEHVRRQQEKFYAAAAAAPHAAAALWADANAERNQSYFAELREGERAGSDVAAGGYETVAAAVATALTGGRAARLIVDVLNRGTVGFLPDDAVIELPCVLDASGATAVPVAPPTLHQQGLMSLVKSCERDVIAAALAGDRNAALRAFALHPLVGSLEAARILVNDWPVERAE